MVGRGASFAAQGSPNFVAGAAVGAAIGESIRTQNDFNNCMLASGWQIADQKPGGPTPDQIKAQALAAIQESKACIAAVRAQTKFDSARAHMADPQTGRYTFAQMSDESFPTPEEASLVASYEDATEPCRATLAQKFAGLDARAAEKVRQRFSDTTALVLLLISRKISWGEYARRAQALSEAAQSNKA